ncbi:MAG TPA: hypothetical protein VF338_07335, partial [Leptolinea sp.]
MCKKQLLVAFSLIIVFAMLLSSCGTPAATTAAPATAAPATAAPAPATAAPATVAPATAAPATTAPATKPIKIGFLAGVQDPFYTTMQRGAQAASDAFGSELVTQIPQAWNVTDQTPMLDAMVAR